MSLAGGRPGGLANWFALVGVVLAARLTILLLKMAKMNLTVGTIELVQPCEREASHICSVRSRLENCVEFDKNYVIGDLVYANDYYVTVSRLNYTTILQSVSCLPYQKMVW